MKRAQTATGFPVLLRAFRLALTVEGLRPRTVDNYLRDIKGFATFIGNKHPDKITATDIRAYCVHLQENHAPKTVREVQLALRRFFRFLVREREIRQDPTSTIKLANFRVDPQPTYTEAEVKRLLLACDTRTHEGLRDRALILILFDTGAREGEIVSMGVPDWDRHMVRVDGKTGVRYAPLGVASLQAVERYVRRWNITEPPLWRGRKGPLTTSGIVQIVRRLCTKAGVEDKGVHAFRRAAAAQMKRLGMNDTDILEVMGWKCITMLRRYTAAVAEELAHAAHRKYSPGDAIGRR